jgi:hypothetical protein
MNNLFNIHRFGLVFRKDFMENWKPYTLLLLTMLTLMMFLLIKQTVNYYTETGGVKPYEPLNQTLLISTSFMFGGFGLLFASMFMNPMDSKTKRTAFLTSPSSTFEKYLSRWLIMTVGYILAFFIVLWVADLLRVGICAAIHPDLEMHFINYNKLVFTAEEGESAGYYIFDKKETFGIAVSLYFLFQSLVILGSTFWEKRSFANTLIAGMAISLAFFLLCRGSILLFYNSFDNFINVLNSFDSLMKPINLKQATKIACTLLSVFTLTNWVLAFFRLRESEIIKRL